MHETHWQNVTAYLLLEDSVYIYIVNASERCSCPLFVCVTLVFWISNPVSLYYKLQAGSHTFLSKFTVINIFLYNDVVKINVGAINMTCTKSKGGCYVELI